MRQEPLEIFNFHVQLNLIFVPHCLLMMTIVGDFFINKRDCVAESMDFVIICFRDTMQKCEHLETKVAVDSAIITTVDSADGRSDLVQTYASLLRNFDSMRSLRE